jgi:hypothetical protein
VQTSGDFELRIKVIAPTAAAGNPKQLLYTVSGLTGYLQVYNNGDIHVLSTTSVLATWSAAFPADRTQSAEIKLVTTGALIELFIDGVSQGTQAWGGNFAFRRIGLYCNNWVFGDFYISSTTTGSYDYTLGDVGDATPVNAGTGTAVLTLTTNAYDYVFGTTMENAA